MPALSPSSLLELLYAVPSLVAVLHALLTKSNPRSATSWIAVCALLPIGGPALYWLFGINRVRRRRRVPADASPIGWPVPEELPQRLEPQVRAGDTLTRLRLEPGNAIEPLYTGEQAFSAMLEAIDQARESVWLTTYIFLTDRVGAEFVAALANAVQRGVQVRVLVDGIGEWYDWPHVVPWLRRLNVPTARFLPPHLLPPSLSLNCRNHRKILVTDGRTAFIGGMNIGEHGTDRGTSNRYMTDMHFRLRGPAVKQIAHTFADDWGFTTGEQLATPTRTRLTGNSVCRAITGGPDQDVDKLLLILLAALANAERRVQIMTPYFIPPLELVAALQTTALRGVEVSVVLPSRSNLRYVDWATQHWIPELVQRGVRIHLQPPPFSHAKLLVIDERYAHIGSVNIDTRSLRLNFEIAMEVYDADFCAELSAFIGLRERAAPALTLDQLRAVPPLSRLRNALCWLVSPYL